MMRPSFPALTRRPDWTYLDSAATCLLPSDVLEAMTDAAASGGSAGRGGHRAGIDATNAYETARAAVAEHLGAATDEVVFVRSATEGLNLIARGWAEENALPGDRILVSGLEHHSNLLPWREAARQTGARTEILDVDSRGELSLDHLDHRLAHGAPPVVLAITHVSNVTGAVLPLEVIIQRVRRRAPRCLVVVDGTQAVPHLQVDPRALGADFYVFSGHKAYGPLGAGVVWGRRERWRHTRPASWGGGMVAHVDAQRETLVPAPWRFEAGTPNHVAAVGLAAGLRWCGRADEGLAELAAARLAELPGVRVLGRPSKRVGLVSFVAAGAHPHDVGTLLDARGVAVRVGRLCAEPSLTALGVDAAVRASFGCFNTKADVQTLIVALGSALDELGVSS